MIELVRRFPRLAIWPGDAPGRWIPLLLISPVLLIVVLVMGFPVLFLGYMSLHKWSLLAQESAKYVGLANYSALIGDQRFLNALSRTLLFTMLGLAISVPLGLGIAFLFHQDFPGRNVLRALLILPMVATPVAMGLVWVIMLDPTLGIIKYLVSSVGLHPPLWLSDPHWVIPTLVLVDSWALTPMVVLICQAGLAALPPEPFEAAMVDGASSWTQLWQLTLPMLRPILIVAIMFRTMDLLKVIDIIYVMTAGGPGHGSETLNLYNLVVGLQYFDVGYGAVVALILFALVSVLVLMLLRYRSPGW